MLRHDGPDGSHHYDWLIASDPAGEGPLVTFRLSESVVRAAAGTEHEIERSLDHRPVYLQFEGALSGGRGMVSRIASGQARVTPGEHGGVCFTIDMKWAAGTRSTFIQVSLRPLGDICWMMRISLA